MSRRPNFFLAIRLSCPQFASSIARLQDQVLQKAPQLQKCRMDTRKLHLTCCVMALAGNEQINKAIDCLISYQDQLSDIVSSLDRKEVMFKSMGNFTTKVLFAAPAQDEVMETLSVITQQLQAKFIEAGVISATSGHENAWHPHATILKTSYDRKNGSRLKIQPQDYAGLETILQTAGETDTTSDNNGNERIDSAGMRVQLTSIDLLAMGEVQEDGYYRSYAQILF